MITMRRRTQQRIEAGMLYTMAAAVLFFLLFPFVWLIMVSLRQEILTFSRPPAILFVPTADHYITSFTKAGLGSSVMNSFIIAIAVTGISVLLGTLAGYSIARTGIGGRPLMFCILFTAMMPGVVVLIPLYLVVQALRLLDTHASLIAINTAFSLPFAVWMMRGFFLDMPPDCEEAAMVDGTTRLGALVRIAIPLAMPAVTATAILTFIGVWNEYMFAVTFYQSKVQTVTVFTSLISLSRFAVEWGPMGATGTVTAVPVVALAFLARRYLLRGLTFGKAG
jgi:multiple sugar transport system permease protein